MRRLLAVVVVLGTLAAARPAVAAGPLVVPLHVERGPFGDPRLGVDVMVGTRTVRVLLDTGSPGLRILASAVPESAVHRVGAVPPGGGYGTGLVLRGDEATAQIAIGDPAAAAQTSIELVDGFTCSDANPNCPASNGRTPEMFGTLFPGILGVSSIDPPRGRCCANPLEALTAYGKRYVVHAAFAAPALTLGPDPATLGGFTMVDVARGTLPRGCIRLSSAANDVCGDVLFDTGTPQIVVTTTGVAAPGPAPAGTTATLTVGGWSHEFTVGSGAPPLRVAMRRGATNRIIVGLAAMQSVDVYYDLAAGRMGLR